METVEFDAPEVQKALVAIADEPSSAGSPMWQEALQVTRVPPRRTTGGVQKPFKPTITPRQIQLHLAHIDQRVSAPGCPLCKDDGTPLIEGKTKGERFKRDVEVSTDMPFVPGRKSGLTIQITGMSKPGYLGEIPSDHRDLVRFLCQRLCPRVRTKESYQIPDELKRFVPEWEAFLRWKLRQIGVIR